MPAAAVRAVFDELESERGMPPCSDTSWAHIRDSKAPTFILAAHITAAAVPHIEAAIREKIAAEIEAEQGHCIYGGNRGEAFDLGIHSAARIARGGSR
jgi:hypothetical protein